MKFDKFLVALSAVIFLAYGAMFLIAPEPAFRLITGGTAAGASALIDLRATYGGMSLGVGALLGVLALNPLWTKAGLFGVLFIMVGMAAGRAVGMAIEPNANSTMWAYLAVEILTAAIVVFALLRKPQST